MIGKLRLLPEVIFESENSGRDLARKSVRSGMTVIATQGVQFPLSVASTIVLARLLTPNDFGLVGMVTVSWFRSDVRQCRTLYGHHPRGKHITHEQISTLFWINLVISAALGLCTWCAHR